MLQVANLHLPKEQDAARRVRNRTGLSKMSEHAVRAAQAQDAAQRAYIQNAVGASPSTANELARLADFKNQGVTSDAEFEQLKESTRLIERVVTTNGA